MIFIKILHILAQLPAFTGSGIYFTKVITEMKKIGIEQAALFGASPDFRWDVIPNTYRVEFEKELNFPVVGMSDIMPYRSTKYGDLTLNQFHYWKKVFHKKLQLAIEEFQPDAILTSHTWILSSMVVREFQGPVYAFCHNTDLRQRQINPHFESELKDLKDVIAVFTSGESEHYELMHYFGIAEEKLIPLGGAYDPEIFYPEKRDPNPKVRYIYPGKLSDSKGTRELIEAFSLLEKEDPNIELLLIGELLGEEGEWIEEKIAGNDRIFLIPPVPQSELGEYFRKSDIFILPSYYEGMPLSPIEALACGNAVIMTNNENLKSLVGEGIVKCGWIDFLEMPKLKGIDQIHPDARKEFIHLLKVSMKSQQRWKDETQSPEIRKEIELHSWSGLVERILQEIKKTLI